MKIYFEWINSLKIKRNLKFLFKQGNGSGNGKSNESGHGT